MLVACGSKVRNRVTFASSSSVRAQERSTRWCAIERDDEVVVREGCRGELLGPVGGAVVAAPVERMESAGVGALADVPVAGAGAAGDDLVAQAAHLGERAQHHLGHGGAADVAGTDEDDAEGIRRGHPSIVPGEG